MSFQKRAIGIQVGCYPFLQVRFEKLSFKNSFKCRIVINLKSVTRDIQKLDGIEMAPDKIHTPIAVTFFSDYFKKPIKRILKCNNFLVRKKQNKTKQKLYSFT